MEKLKAAWEFIDGHKTQIGALVVLIGKALKQFDATASFADAVETAGDWIAAGGLAHAAVKMVPKKDAE